MNNEPAFPCTKEEWVPPKDGSVFSDGHTEKIHFSGLTKRELIAAMAMQGYNASPIADKMSSATRAFLSTQDADALLAELKKEESK